jgi:hypothetical protein
MMATKVTNIQQSYAKSNTFSSPLVSESDHVCFIYSIISNMPGSQRYDKSNKLSSIPSQSKIEVVHHGTEGLGEATKKLSLFPFPMVFRTLRPD